VVVEEGHGARGYRAAGDVPRVTAAVKMAGVTVIKINAITVPEGSGDELARRFAARAGAVDGQEGFEGFELLRPTDDRTTWLVVTRWRDEAAFEAWVSSPAFAHGHQSERAGGGEGHGGAPQGHGSQGGHGGQAPLAMSSELWSYEIAGGAAGGDGR
jgi:heme oxygenase (mycobilin-producing)